MGFLISGIIVDILRRDTGFDDGGELHEDAGGDFSRLAHFTQLIGVAYGNSIGHVNAVRV